MDLISYLHGFLQKIKDFESIFAAENVEFDKLYSSINQSLNDSFIDTASDQAISRQEQFFKIVKQGTLDQRKAYLKSLKQHGNKLSEVKIKEIVNTIASADCIVTFYTPLANANPHSGYGCLLVQIINQDNTKNALFSDIDRALRPLIPAHIKLSVKKYYCNWGDVKSNMLDWQDIRTNMLDWQDVYDLNDKSGDIKQALINDICGLIGCEDGSVDLGTSSEVMADIFELIGGDMT